MRAIWLAVLISASEGMVAQAADARWESERDNKTPAELARLSDRELFQEAFDVCVRRAGLLAGGRETPGVDRSLAAADDYLAVIEAAARARLGVVPAWLRELSFARNSKECQAVFRAFVSGETAPETQPAEGTPAKGSPKATSPRSVKDAGSGAEEKAGKSTPTRTPIIRVPAFPLLWHTPTPVRRTPTASPRGTVDAESRQPIVRYTPQPGQVEQPVPDRVTPYRTTPPSREEVTDELPPWFR